MSNKKNKSKKEIVSDIQLVQDAERRRSLIRDILFPYLLKLDENIGYSKVFLQAYSGLIEGVYEEYRKKTTLDHLMDKIEEKLRKVFVFSDPDQKREYDRYMELSSLLKDVSVQDISYAAELPRYIDGYLMKDVAKKSIKEIKIDDLLG